MTILFLVVTLFVIGVLVYLILCGKKKLSNVNKLIELDNNTIKCLWENPCNSNGTLDQDCLDNTGNTVKCSTLSSPSNYLKSGICSCTNNYVGQYCQYSDITTCNSNGKAQSDGTCKCNVNYYGSNCEYGIKSTCNGNGTPNDNGICSCYKPSLDSDCLTQSFGCDGHCPLGSTTFINTSNNIVTCQSVSLPNLNSWVNTCANNSKGCGFSSISSSIMKQITIYPNKPIIITTCKLMQSNRPRVLYRDPSSNSITFADLETIRSTPSNYVWRWNTDQSYHTLSLYSDWIDGNKNIGIDWTGMTANPIYGSSDEMWVEWDDKNKVFCYGSNDNNCKGHLGYNPSNFYVGPNPDWGMIFQDQDVWYSILTDGNGTLPF